MAKEAGAEEYAILSQIVDVPKGCEEAATMTEEMGVVAKGQKLGLSIVGPKEVGICYFGAGVHVTPSKHAIFDFAQFNDRGIRIAEIYCLPLGMEACDHI